MFLRLTLLITILFSSNIVYSQVPSHIFGEPTTAEHALKHYPQDPEANGVILYERGNYTVDAADGYIRLLKEVHCKIKVFNAKDFKYSHIEIPYYRENNVQENIKDLKGITHNGDVKTYITDNAIFDTDESENWSLKKFTFPDVKDGSILEYSYRIETPYLHNLGGWNFMNSLPTIYSELHTEIPGNYTYNRTLFGDRKLDVNHAEVKKSCFQLPGYKVSGDCESATYVMKHIPAFKEEEYMLAGANYRPRLQFELRNTVNIDGSKKNYSKTWKDTDKIFKYDKNLGKQLKHTSFFEKQLPANISNISDKLERAKAVYYFIQKNMNWNKENRILSDIRVKDAFEKKSGNSSEINLSLINALEAVGLQPKIMLLATRDRAQPTKQYPVMTDFNYAIVYLNIDNTTYLLDATSKHTPFGILPYRLLNVEGRVLDFKKGSFWEPIKSTGRNLHYVNMQLSANANGEFTGKVSEASTGNISAVKRDKNNGIIKDQLIKRKQSKNEALDISNLSFENETNLEQPYKESYDLTIFEQLVGDKLYVYPFLFETYVLENPFKEEKRRYPIDFGFPIINNYLIAIDGSNQYEVVKTPENKILKLPNNDGELSVVYKVVGNKVNVRLSVKLNNTHFPKEAYPALRQFFTTLVNIQNEAPIEFKKM